jgi:hypothetical protein
MGLLFVVFDVLPLSTGCLWKNLWIADEEKRRRLRTPWGLPDASYSCKASNFMQMIVLVECHGDLVGERFVLAASIAISRVSTERRYDQVTDSRI